MGRRRRLQSERPEVLGFHPALDDQLERSESGWKGGRGKVIAPKRRQKEGERIAAGESWASGRYRPCFFRSLEGGAEEGGKKRGRGIGKGTRLPTKGGGTACAG